MLPLLIGPLVSGVLGVIDKAVEDKDQANAIKAKFNELAIANNYIIVPIFNTTPAEIPPDMWDLLKLGVGGYVVGRSVEKGVKTFKQ